MTMTDASSPLTATLATPSAPPLRRAYIHLLLISFAILFFELACIRWVGSTVVFMTFFTNLVLMACFLGMTVGCLTASRKQNFINVVIPLALLTVILAYGVLWAYSRFGELMIDVGGQASPQQIYFGTEARLQDLSRFIIPIEAVAGLFYVLIALMFVGLGQVMGRTFNAIPNHIAAYTMNILGSLLGIAAFGVASYFHTTPLLWFAVSLGIGLYFVNRQMALQILTLIAILVFIALMAYGESGDQARLFWSPYYKIRYTPQSGDIKTNNIGHQTMLRIEERGAAYVLPHLLSRDALGRPFKDILIIGAGSGNDVQGALLHGATHIDAVEIDPVLYEIGWNDHPNHPYADPRVTIHLDDGRSFVRQTSQTYDLVIYALVDSLVLHSSYSSLRLESFLFTEQAFHDIKAKLKPGGVFAMYNFYRQGWVVGRLEKMAEKVFGSKPIVISLPYQDTIRPADNQRGHFTLLLVGNIEATVVEAIRQRLVDAPFFWVHPKPRYNQAINGFGPEPPAVTGTRPAEWEKIGMATVDTTGIDRLPSDDWPFLYLREPMVPGLNIRGMLMVAILSLAILFLFAPVRTISPNGQMFFLGAGFMLLETKGVVHLALLFGSTWVVNSIVFFSVLILILLSNLFVWTIKPKNLWLYYGLLITSLLVNTYVPMSTFLALPGVAKVFVSCAVIFVPLFFAGVIFATAFRDSRQPDVDFGSNIGGVILGGLSEYFSLMVGFNYLLFIAIAFYLLSMIFKPHLQLVPAIDGR
jgi:Spermine/spermidine synthase domain